MNLTLVTLSPQLGQSRVVLAEEVSLRGGCILSTDLEQSVLVECYVNTVSITNLLQFPNSFRMDHREQYRRWTTADAALA
jgi:hypothetical protein